MPTAFRQREHLHHSADAAAVADTDSQYKIVSMPLFRGRIGLSAAIGHIKKHMKPTTMRRLKPDMNILQMTSNFKNGNDSLQGTPTAPMQQLAGFPDVDSKPY